MAALDKVALLCAVPAVAYITVRVIGWMILQIVPLAFISTLTVVRLRQALDHIMIMIMGQAIMSVYTTEMELAIAIGIHLLVEYIDNALVNNRCQLYFSNILLPKD